MIRISKRYVIIPHRGIVSAKVWATFAAIVLMCLMPYQTVDLTYLESGSLDKLSGTETPDILLMGNSYVASNSLDALVDGVMSAASTNSNVSSLTSGGMRLSQHWNNVQSVGHQWNTTLNNGNWDWVVLQDQSQIPGFPRSQSEWIASKDGAVKLAEVIEDNGAETVLMMTWGRRDGDSTNSLRFPDFSTMQNELARGYLDYRDNISSNGGNAWVAPVGLAFEHIHDKIVAEGGTPSNSGNTFYDLYTGDGSHPSVSGSYLAALVIYATLTGENPVGIPHSTSLSNALVLELQQAAAATVFNETSHLIYPWQTNTQVSSTQTTLAYEWLAQHGAGQDYEITDIVVDSYGDLFAIGKTEPLSVNSTYGSCEFTKSMVFFVMKLQSTGQCLWISDVTVSNSGNMASSSNLTSIDIDSNGNIFVTGFVMGAGNGQSKTFEFESSITYKPPNNPVANGFVGKIDSTGVWQWVSVVGNDGIEVTSVALNSLDQIFISGYMTTADFVSDGFGQYKPFISKISQTGSTDWTNYVEAGDDGSACYSTTNSNNNMKFTDIAINSLDDIIVTGFMYNYENPSYCTSYDFDNINIYVNKSELHNKYTTLIAQIDSSGNWDWAKTWDYASGTNKGYDVTLDNSDNVIISGSGYSEIIASTTYVDSGGSENGFVAKADSNGNWIWIQGVVCNCRTNVYAVASDSSNDIWFAGTYSSTFNIGSISLNTMSGARDAFVAKFASNGTSIFAIGGGTTGNDDSSGFAIHPNDGAYLAGIVGGPTSTFGSHYAQNSGGKDWFITKLTRDYDGDLQPDAIDDDDDGDFIIDILDQCKFSPLGFESVTALDHDSDGCRDSDEDDDDDNDGLFDDVDSCSKGMTGWTSTNLTDLDGDGCFDALEDYDDDADGYEDFEDFCPRTPGNSTFEYERGCPDKDGDGRPDILDAFPNDPSEWEDSDNDGYGNNIDIFPMDATQNKDTDGDGYGDFTYGNGGDACPTVPGTSTIDRRGCIDSDGDGYSDEGDDFPNDPDEYLDTDGDGIPDHADAFPFDPTQQSDRDRDGYGDNANGNLGDVFPDDPTKHFDSDRDGYDDSSDAFPFDPTQWEDADGDGMGDNKMGIGADKFPNDPTQWGDIDGDGYGDNQNGTNPDAFPTDATQWSDADGDGYGDNPSGRLYDQFPLNPTQWIDEDGDGIGDNQSGTDADPYLNDLDNDGYNDTIDILPRFASPGDLDADGCMDEVDAFMDNPLECLDTDGDGIGDNADADDDNDEWTDADEIRAGTDPLDPNDTPIDSFEIVIPGTQIGLGAWDLIGIFGGVPIFTWLAFGFVTRNKRCARFEDELSKAQSRQELEEIALRWEFSLMLRLLGPHQGIRLERIRSELDDEFENAENMLVSQEITPMTSVDQTPLVEEFQKETPSEFTKPSVDSKPDQIDEFGYQWIKHNGENYYRGSDDDDWNKLEE